jgi:hypothetical protein
VTSGGRLVPAVERKSLPDLVSSVTSGRLKYALGELAALPRAAVVVEDRYSRLFKLDHVRPAVVTDGLAELQVGWPTVAIVFCETRPLAEEWTYRYLAAASTWAATESDALARIPDLPVLTSAPRAPGPLGPPTAQVRAWARAAGIDVPDPGPAAPAGVGPLARRAPRTTLNRPNRPIGAELQGWAVLRHQLAVLRRQVAGPRYTPTDRLVLATLAKLLPRQRWPVFLVTPSTLLRWHRERVRRHWTYPRAPCRDPRALPEDVVELVLKLATENRRWGYLRIVGRADSSASPSPPPRSVPSCAPTGSAPHPNTPAKAGCSSSTPKPPGRSLATSSPWRPLA